MNDNGVSTLEQPEVGNESSTGRRKRGGKKRPYPTCSFEQALELAYAIQEAASGQKIRRITLFDHLRKAPESGTSRQLVSNSAKYRLTTGSAQSEHLELTKEGDLVTRNDGVESERLYAKFQCAILSVESFKLLYEQYRNNKLPTRAVMQDFLVETGMESADIPQCIDLFIINAQYIGLLRVLSGAERLLSIEHMIEEIGDTSTPQRPVNETHHEESELVLKTAISAPLDSGDLNNVCFYITPIGEDNSEQRMHSDLFLNSIVEPALSEFGLKVVRADNIGKPGMITGQIIQHVIRSKLVIADLSFHNPNVFYELSLRHACRKPTVQLIRAHDFIPFDLSQFRTVKIDTSSIYTLVPKMETYKAQIAEQVRMALNDPESMDNPIYAAFPGLKISY